MNNNQKQHRIALMHSGKPTLEEINPKIKEVLIKMSFDKNFEYSHDPYSLILKPSDKAFYTPDCINSSCTKGFFDLSTEILQLLKDNNLSAKGEKRCDGWQDLERKENHRCLAILSYELSANYFPE